MPKPTPSFLQTYAKAPVLGAAFGSLIVLGAIILSAHSFLAFFSLGGLMIVLGGVIAVAFMSFQVEDVQRALNAIGQMLKRPAMTEDNLNRDMVNILYWACLVKEKGMRNLEANIGKNGIADPFVKYGLNMVVSQYSPEEVRAMMETAADACYERDSMPVDVLHAMASHAPAFGMVGTLVGMVAMLCSLGDSVSGIGPTLAISFLSTLYGVISARMIYMPAASRLQQEVDNCRFRNHLITEGMVMLVGNKNPMYIQDRLNSFLKPEVHNYFDYFNLNIRRADMAVKPPAKPVLQTVNA
ncbi:MAG: MotA/TolQ/ExbB proton channel family protein [Pseudomonadota bacterium]|nr:MotA/TolQ/ExbB proton channel family protein [Pseudomonadota bacterium]